MNVGADILAVLDRATIDGNAVILGGRIDRALYVRANKVLEAAGGRWDRRARAHLFEDDAGPILEAIRLTGKVSGSRQDLGAFYTPPGLVRLVIERAELARGMTVLEPSAGMGALAIAAIAAGCTVDCCEINPRAARLLGALPFRRVVEADFLTQAPDPIYDRAVMNPPFLNGQDCIHVLHALRFLRPGGRLVAIMAAGLRTRVGAAQARVRAAAALPGGAIDDLPAGAFRAAGTAVNTILVTLVPSPTEADHG